MKDTSRQVLGYLAAFSLGLVCMAVIVTVVRRESRTPEEVEATPLPDQASTAVAPESFKREFGMPPARTSPPAPPRFTAEPLRPQAPSPRPAGEEPLIAADRPVPALPVVFSSVRITDVQGALAPVPRQVARLSGRVLLRGTPPPERAVSLDRFCAKEYPRGLTTRFYRVGKDRGLADVVVQITAGLPDETWPVPQQARVLSQKKCLFEPYISAVQVGQKTIVRNDDELIHSITITHATGESFRSLLKRSQVDFAFAAPQQFVRLRCDVHPWDFAYIAVVSHPFFAVTDMNGNFVIPDLPPGEYTIQAHHRKAGTVSQQFEIVENRGTHLELALDAAPLQAAMK